MLLVLLGVRSTFQTLIQVLDLNTSAAAPSGCITLDCWLRNSVNDYLEPFSRSWGCCMTVAPLRCSPEFAVIDSC